MADPSQADVKSATADTFITALVFNAVVVTALLVGFTILRPRFKAIYEPRTYVPPPSKRIGPMSPSLFAWPLEVYRADYRAIYSANGLDAYFFVRFLRLMVIILLPIWVLTWALLLPLTSIKSSIPGHDNLDKFSFGNVQPDLNARYWGHVAVAYVITIWVCYNIKKEMAHFVLRRQDYLTDPSHAKSVQAHTILVSGIPNEYLSPRALTRLFGHLPGGVKKVWMNRNLKDLPDLYDRRLAACNKLESAETKLLRTAAEIRLKANKDKTLSGNTPDPERDASPAEQLVPRDQRPSHRLPLGFMPFSLPLIGQKVDSIEWAREEIRACGELLDKARDVISRDDAASDSDAENKEGQTYPKLNSAFVTFHEQMSAHLALQSLSHHEAYRMSGKWGEMSPQDVIWGNLGMNPYEQKVRTVISYAITAVLIIFWAIPVAFVGAVSNVHALCTKFHWLAWICKLKGPVVGIISGILPAVMLAVLLMVLPIFLRFLARFQGIPKKTGLELSLMTRFFLFQVIHSFLVVTISAGIVQALQQIAAHPAQAPTFLAQNMPSASTFFLTFIILQGLSGTGGGFLQIVTLIVYYVKLYLLGSTPRSLYGIKYGARSVEWGTLFPIITLLVVIALGYSVISPIMNGLACVTFFAFYMMYKYMFLYVLDESGSTDTGGLFYPKAIQHVFVGLYISQVCLFALFFLAKDPNTKKQITIPEGVVTVALLMFTAFYHWLINNSYDPLIDPLPLTLANKTAGGNLVADVEPSSQPIQPVDAKEPETKEKGGRLKRMLTEDEYGYAHPALTRPQRVVWIPRDTLGLAKAEEEACRAAGVEASSQDAVMNEKGSVDIEGPPPDEPERV